MTRRTQQKKPVQYAVSSVGAHAHSQVVSMTTYGIFTHQEASKCVIFWLIMYWFSVLSMIASGVL
jgi:hypothetical protein